MLCHMSVKQFLLLLKSFQIYLQDSLIVTSSHLKKIERVRLQKIFQRLLVHSVVSTAMIQLHKGLVL